MRKLLVLIFIFLPLFSLQARAFSSDADYEGPTRWDSFQKYMEERQKEDRLRGASYMISGALLTVGGVAGYYGSDDAFSRAIYAITQSVGVAAIGYGATNYWIGNEYNSFYAAVEGSHLSPEQKAELLYRFLDHEKAEREKTKWIKIATHSLIALANLYSAAHEQDGSVKSVLEFLAGTNAVIAISYAF